MVDRRIHRCENERGLLQPGCQGGREQERILIALVLVEMVFRQGDCGESADISMERQVGEAVEKRSSSALVLNTGAEDARRISCGVFPSYCSCQTEAGGDCYHTTALTARQFCLPCSAETSIDALQHVARVWNGSNMALCPG